MCALSHMAVLAGEKSKRMVLRTRQSIGPDESVDATDRCIPTAVHWYFSRGDMFRRNCRKLNNENSFASWGIKWGMEHKEGCPSMLKISGLSYRRLLHGDAKGPRAHLQRLSRPPRKGPAPLTLKKPTASDCTGCYHGIDRKPFLIAP